MSPVTLALGSSRLFVFFHLGQSKGRFAVWVDQRTQTKATGGKTPGNMHRSQWRFTQICSAMVFTSSWTECQVIHSCCNLSSDGK